ncbi:MAG: hypothetical protein IPO00_08870 [Betaproteobacteria bacterium]|nr:hypothetical protein [Betaproteobacteria bacterium]
MATWTQLGVRSIRSVQALTETPPAALDASEGVGIVLDSLGALTFWLDAGDGQATTATTSSGSVWVMER